MKSYTWLWENTADISSSNHNPQHQVVLKDSVGKWFPKCLDCHDTVFEFYYSLQLGSVSGNLRSFETYVPTLLTVFPPTLRLFLSLSSPHNLFFISLDFIQLSHAGIRNE